ncbi:MAG: hypothetical protein AAF420_11440 [Pseudomonadota bacterium]
MTDDLHKKEEQWLDATRRQLDASEASIDGATRGRLRAARREALSRAQASGSAFFPRWSWAPAAVLMVLVLFNLSGNVFQQTPMLDQSVQSTALLEDLPLLSGEDDLEMLGELEFYLWLAESDIG